MNPTRTVLVTGFEQFGGDATNSSQEIARRLHGSVSRGHQVVGAVLPCVFGASIRELQRLVRATKPTLVVSLGQANERGEITPERVAINLDDARIPDNAGLQPADRKIVARGPVAYWSSLPVKAIVAALREQGIQSSVSHTAGTFVCNHVFYGLMRSLSRPAARGMRGGFIHVPRLVQAGVLSGAGWSLGSMVDAVKLAIDVSLRS